MPTPTLKVVKGPAEGGSIALEGDDLLIGREGQGEGLLGGDLEISRRHARVFQKGEKILIEDLGSTNGTMVNGRKIKQAHGAAPRRQGRRGHHHARGRLAAPAQA